MNNKEAKQYLDILNSRGVQKNFSFKVNVLQKLHYLEKLSEERFGGNDSAALVECIACHEFITKQFGDWRTISQEPPWISRILNRLKQVQVIADDGSQDEKIKESLQGLQLSDELFE